MTQVKLICKCCGDEFYTPLNRYNYLKKKDNLRNFYCNKSCFIKDINVKPIKKICLFCNKEFDSTTSVDARKCCSSTCSAKYSGSFVDPIKTSIISKNIWKNKIRIPKKRICNFCKKEFTPTRYEKCCGEECKKMRISVGGRNSINIQKENRRSKNEIYFSKLCDENFSNVMVNEPIFNGWDADVVLPNEKIAILWNGKWHYDKIKQKHSVTQVQNRDKIKLNEIIKAGYVPYVIKDLGRENNIFVEEEFRKFRSFLLTDYKNGV